MDFDQKINTFITGKGSEGFQAFEIWDKVKDRIEDNAIKDEMKTLLKHYRTIDGVYLECKRNYKKSIRKKMCFFRDYLQA